MLSRKKPEGTKGAGDRRKLGHWRNPLRWRSVTPVRDVVVNYVSREEEAQRVVAEIQRCGAQAYAHRADVSSEADVERMFATMIAEFGTVDIVVNNAGLQKDAPFHELTVSDWDLVMNVNLKGQFLCSRAAVREFEAPRCRQRRLVLGGQNYLHQLGA